MIVLAFFSCPFFGIKGNTMTKTTIDLIRHGEPEGGSRYRGYNVDDPLSEKGWSQMWAAVGDYDEWDIIITSPLQRCRAFAEALGEKRNISVVVEKNLKEVGFGSWEGKTPAEIKEKNLVEFDAFYADPVNNRPEGAEPLDEFIQRVVGVYTEVVEKYSGKHLLIVAHAGVNRALIANAIDASPAGMYRIDVRNAGLSRVVGCGKGNNKLEFHNFMSL